MVFVRSVFGVPNISGWSATFSFHNTSTTPSGAFQVHQIKPTTYFQEVQSSENEIADNMFYASLSNPTYVDQGTVRPKSISVLVLLRL